MRFTHDRFGGSHWLLAAAGVVLGGAASLYAAEKPRLYIEPIAGLTTVRHVAPESIAVPVGMVLNVSHQLPTGAGGTDPDVVGPGSDPTASVPRDPIRWLGATESDRSSDMSRAELAIDREGEYMIEATLDDVDGTTIHSVLRVRAVDVALDRVSIRRAVPTVDVRPLTEESTNWDTMQAYFGESIAPLVSMGASRDGLSRGAKPALNRFRTSIGRTIRFDLRTDPPGFESLMEVRANGMSRHLAESNPQYFVTPGVHHVSVGPPRLAREFEIETYEVVITSHVQGVDRVPDGEPITFTAVTNPPGYEDEIHWLSSTKYGSAHPVTGRGPTFTTQFDHTGGPHPEFPGASVQWLGVKASSVVLGVDMVFCEPCGNDEAVAEYASIPGGLFLFQQCSCAAPVGVATGKCQVQAITNAGSSVPVLVTCNQSTCTGDCELVITPGTPIKAKCPCN